MAIPLLSGKQAGLLWLERGAMLFWNGSLPGALGLTGGGWTPKTADAIVDSAPGTPPLEESSSLQ